MLKTFTQILSLDLFLRELSAQMFLTKNVLI